MFETIKTIDDVLPHLSGTPEIIVKGSEDYSAIDYVYQTESTFHKPILRECRGLKFDRQGRILARPLHKFFNYGENGFTPDLSPNHVIMTKLDGSMVHPAIVSGNLRLMTRAGITDVSMMAEKHFLWRPEYTKFMLRFVDHGWTPVFEFTSLQNRIVLRYEQPGLTVLAARNNITGEYLAFESLVDEARCHNVPVVQTLPYKGEDMLSFVSFVKSLNDVEGFVVRLDNGDMVKIKTEEYVLKHRALDDLSSKKKVLALVLQGFADDVIGFLNEQDAEELKGFKDKVLRQVNVTVQMMQDFAFAKRNLSQKDYALLIKDVSQFDKSLLFAARNSPETLYSFVIQQYQKHPEQVIATWRGE